MKQKKPNLDVDWGIELRWMREKKEDERSLRVHDVASRHFFKFEVLVKNVVESLAAIKDGVTSRHEAVKAEPTIVLTTSLVSKTGFVFGQEGN